MNQIEKVARAIYVADRDGVHYDADTYEPMAKAAIAAMPVQAEPVAWMYIRKPEEWPPSKPIVQLTRRAIDDPARPFWTEHALCEIPTPPAGGSDAE